MKKFFTTNIELKIASLIIATSMWFFVMLSGRSNVSIDVPIQFINLPQELEIVEPPVSVKVNIEGPSSIINGMKEDELRAVVDLKDTRAGRAVFSLSQKNIKLPETLVVTGLDPETISIKIEERLKKTVRIKPAVTGLPEKGFVISDIVVEPESVTIEGPKSVISKIKKVKTEPLDINGINSDLKYRANLNISNTHIKKDVNKVVVHISVKKIE
jgi:YbbR domain-containing protein